jgi:hypothetical protein
MWAVTVADGRKCPWAEGGLDGDEGVEVCVCVCIRHGWRSHAKIFLICAYLPIALMNSSCRRTAMSTAQAALQGANGRQSMFGLPVLCKDEKFQGSHPKHQKREETKSGKVQGFQGSTTQDSDCARLLQAEEDALSRGIDESMAGDLQYARLLQEEEWAAVARNAAHQKDGKSKPRDERDEVLVLESEVTREGRPCPENCDENVCSEDCDEDVCPDLHEMFVYYDAIYFG